MPLNSTNLNPMQEEAANHIEGPLLVLAGAGSGKTRVVTYRIAHLIEIGVPPSDILALTFTNKAAGEMRERIQDLTRQNIVATTFHSLGARILREAIEPLGYKTDFTIYDEQDTHGLVKSCLKTLSFKDDKSALKEVKSAISNAKSELVMPDEMKNVDGWIQETYALYQTRLKAYNALDFDDLLFQTIRLFRTSPETLARFQKRWSFLLIDEYQDTNHAQYLIAKMLSEKTGNLFAVGDPDQSIYSWRGADIGNILNFENDFPGAKVIKLEQNYRSTCHILQGANSLIDHNASRYPKELWSKLGDGEKIGFFVGQNDREEGDFVIETILNHHRRNRVPLNDMVIFYRTNSQSRIFEDLALRHDIPYEIVGGLSFYQRREIKDILAYLRMAHSSSDFLSFARTINLPKRGIGPTTLHKLRDAAHARLDPITTFCDRLLSGEYDDVRLSQKQRTGLREYLDILHMLRAMDAQKKPLKEIVLEAIEGSNYLSYLQEDKETFADRKGNLDELIAKAAEWGEGTLSLFLEEITLRSSQEFTAYDDVLKFMTLHNGKGLEFRIAFITGLEEDLLPHINSKGDLDAIEEERRLTYVGMTRAKERLYLSLATYRYIWGMPKVMEKSRFLNEIDAKHLVNLSPESSYDDDYDDTYNGGEETYSPGTLIYHKTFGKGLVQKAYQTSLGLTYDVRFDDPPITRSLVAKYAKFTVFD